MLQRGHTWPFRRLYRIVIINKVTLRLFSMILILHQISVGNSVYLVINCWVLLDPLRHDICQKKIARPKFFRQNYAQKETFTAFAKVRKLVEMGLNQWKALAFSHFTVYFDIFTESLINIMYKRASMLTTGVSSKSKRRKKRTIRHEGVIEKEDECVKQCMNDRDMCTKKKKSLRKGWRHKIRKVLKV